MAHRSYNLLTLGPDVGTNLLIDMESKGNLKPKTLKHKHITPSSSPWEFKRLRASRSLLSSGPSKLQGLEILGFRV